MSCEFCTPSIPQHSMKIALIDTKFPHNVGAVLRAASCYGAQEVCFSGQRVADQILHDKRIPREERMRGYRDVELVYHQNPLEHFRSQGTPIAVELRPNSECLFEFEHPQDPIYVFGPEDGSLDRTTLTRCHRFVSIPTRHCTNLAAAVYTVLYDRALKAWMQGGEKPPMLNIDPVSEDDHASIFVQRMQEALKNL